MKPRNSYKTQHGGKSKHKKKYTKRLSIKEIEDSKKPRRLSKIQKEKVKYPHSPSPNKSIRNTIKHKNAEQEENKRIITIVERLFDKFVKFKNSVRYEDDVNEIKESFQYEMCRDNLFKVRKTICGVGSYKVVLLCKEDIADCKYVYAFDFKHHPKEPGDEQFMKGGLYGDLYEYDNILSLAPIFHRKLYCGYKDIQRVDFMLLPNNGEELFNFLYVNRTRTKFKSGTPNNLWLSFVFLMTALYSFGMLHNKGYVHRDLKPENMLIGNHYNADKDYLTITDYGFVMHQNAKKYDLTGTGEYLTPKISRIFEGLQSSSTLKFTDFIEHDLHSIGYVFIQIMICELFSSISSKPDCKRVIEKCGKKAAKQTGNKCSIDAITYLACNDRVDGSLGEKSKLLNIKQKKHGKISLDTVPNFPDYALEIMRENGLILAEFGFESHLKDITEGRHYAINCFYRIARKLRKHEDFEIFRKVMRRGVLKVKLNPIIWSEIERV
jgi:serine/threonine protein kinase